MNNAYDNPVDRAMALTIATDTLQREMYRLYGPTPAEQREHEAREKALAFETGDHQPDGTVRHTRASIDAGTACAGQDKPNNVYDAAGLCGGANLAAKLGQGVLASTQACAASNANVPSPLVQRAISQMEQGLARQQQVDMQVLVMQFALHLNDEDRARIEANPPGLQRVIEQMQRELVCELNYEYGINVEFAA